MKRVVAEGEMATPRSTGSPLWATVALFAIFAPSAQAEITFEWVTVGHPGNVCDPQPQGCFGAVSYPYRITTTEVTNAQYAEFLNAVAFFSDPNELYDQGMTVDEFYGGISRSGNPGTYVYSANAGRENKPVKFVTFYDVLRFANWLHNGQPRGLQNNSTTEDGAYAISPGLDPQNSGLPVKRNIGARAVLTSEGEWYKAAYYDTSSMSYFDYPAGTDNETACADIGATPNTANCDAAHKYPPLLNNPDVSDVGSYTGAATPNDTFDQGGNVQEWVDVLGSTDECLRGGDFVYPGPQRLASDSRLCGSGLYADFFTGFRLASPMPHVPSLSGLGITLLSGIVGLAGAAGLQGRAT